MTSQSLRGRTFRRGEECPIVEQFGTDRRRADRRRAVQVLHLAFVAAQHRICRGANSLPTQCPVLPALSVLLDSAPPQICLWRLCVVCVVMCSVFIITAKQEPSSMFVVTAKQQPS